MLPHYLVKLHLKYVPCSCFLTLVSHKVVWRHMQRVVEFLLNPFTANLPRNLPVKKK